MHLYYAPGSCAFASLVCMCEVSAEFTPHRIALADGEQNSQSFRAINPRGRVPTLVCDDTVITETIAILIFIANKFPAARLLPNCDPLALAKACEFMAWLASSVHVSVAQIWRSERFVDDEIGAKLLRQAGPARLEAAYAEIDRRLAGPWALGNEYTVMDPYLAVFFRWGERLEFDMSRYARWQDHNAALMLRPAVRQALAIESAPAMEVTQMR